MDGIESVFDRTFVVARNINYIKLRTPPFGAIFFDVIERRAFFFRQIAEKRIYDSVAFLHRIGINFRARWNSLADE